MFEIFFGALWLLICIPIFIPFLFFADEAGIWPVLMGIVFIGIGIVFVVVGARKVIKNKKTDKYGEECYALINAVYPSGTYINNRPEYKADCQVYIPSTNSIEYVSEIVGMNDMLYPENSVFKVKYYNGDINFIEKVQDINLVPYNASVSLNLSHLNENTNNSRGTNIVEISSDIIEVNGVKYKRMD